MTEDLTVMPLYLVCDVSAGMTEEMAALNEGLKRFIHSLVENPLLCDVARLGILAFLIFRDMLSD
jgi:uncharacterized protein YegL